MTLLVIPRPSHLPLVLEMHLLLMRQRLHLSSVFGIHLLLVSPSGWVCSGFGLMPKKIPYFLLRFQETGWPKKANDCHYGQKYDKLSDIKYFELLNSMMHRGVIVLVLNTHTCSAYFARLRGRFAGAHSC